MASYEIQKKLEGLLKERDWITQQVTEAKESHAVFLRERQRELAANSREIHAAVAEAYKQDAQEPA